MKLLKQVHNYNSKEKYYEDKLRCKACNQDIENLSIPNYFILTTKDSKRYICLHYKCTFKKEAADILDSLLNNFDYTAPL